MPWIWSKKKKPDGAGNAPNNKAQQIPQVRFENANPWRPDFHQMFYCNNGQDNQPDKVRMDNDYVFYISQCRSPGHKDQGQDCMAAASHKNWEVSILCDGHDRFGHLVAIGVCQQLPAILLRRIHERPDSEVDSPVSEDLINESFDECSRVVCWTAEGITIGIWVKVFEGQWANKPGYIKESTSSGKVRVAIIDENGYHLPPIDRKMLRRPRYVGGCTCVVFIRNAKTNECRIAACGDSRLIVLPTLGVKDSVLTVKPGVQPADSEKSRPEGLISPAHNVFNEEERARLQRDYPGQFEFDNNFLVNPITKFAIQPTRGFGDFDMYGTGYTHFPEISCTFKLQPNTLIFTASDGVFDNHVWQDEELITCLQKHIEDGSSTKQIVDSLYRETLQRSLEGGYVDDISIFCFRAPSTEPQVPPVGGIKDEDYTPLKVIKKKDTASKRKTIQRNEPTFSTLSEQIAALQKEREETAKKAAAAKAAAEKAVTEEEHPEIVEAVGNVMKRIAKTKGVDYDSLDSKGLATGKSFSNLNDIIKKDAESEEEDE